MSLRNMLMTREGMSLSGGINLRHFSSTNRREMSGNNSKIISTKFRLKIKFLKDSKMIKKIPKYYYNESLKIISFPLAFHSKSPAMTGPYARATSL